MLSFLAKKKIGPQERRPSGYRLANVRSDRDGLRRSTGLRAATHRAARHRNASSASSPRRITAGRRPNPAGSVGSDGRAVLALRA